MSRASWKLQIFKAAKKLGKSLSRWNIYASHSKPFKEAKKRKTNTYYKEKDKRGEKHRNIQTDEVNKTLRHAREYPM